MQQAPSDPWELPRNTQPGIYNDANAAQVNSNTVMQNLYRPYLHYQTSPPMSYSMNSPVSTAAHRHHSLSPQPYPSTYQQTMTSWNQSYIPQSEVILYR